MRWAVALLACCSAQRREVLEGVEGVWQAPPERLGCALPR